MLLLHRHIEVILKRYCNNNASLAVRLLIKRGMWNSGVARLVGAFICGCEQICGSGAEALYCFQAAFKANTLVSCYANVNAILDCAFVLLAAAHYCFILIRGVIAKQ